MANLTIWDQKTITLPIKQRGCHIITNNVQNYVSNMQCVDFGLLHLFICHTSASITINENADATVREDFEAHFNKLCPENAPYYKHTIEGADDMPAHLKTSLLGTSLSIPVKKNQLLLGTWQGIYLCEHRNNHHERKIILTLCGCK